MHAADDRTLPPPPTTTQVIKEIGDHTKLLAKVHQVRVKKWVAKFQEPVRRYILPARRERRAPATPTRQPTRCNCLPAGYLAHLEAQP